MSVKYLDDKEFWPFFEKFAKLSLETLQVFAERIPRDELEDRLAKYPLVRKALVKEMRKGLSSTKARKLKKTLRALALAEAIDKMLLLAALQKK